MEDNLLAPEPVPEVEGDQRPEPAPPPGHSQGIAQRLQTLREENGLGAAAAPQPSNRSGALWLCRPIGHQILLGLSHDAA